MILEALVGIFLYRDGGYILPADSVFTIGFLSMNAGISIGTKSRHPLSIRSLSW